MAITRRRRLAFRWAAAGAAAATVAGVLALAPWSANADTADTAALPAPTPCTGCWHPGTAVTWNWVIHSTPTQPFRQVDMYDIDGFEATPEIVAALHAQNIKAVCYFSAGTWEDWRPDAEQFPTALRGAGVDRGNGQPWQGEKWLDIRDITKPDSRLAAVMNARLDMCRSKGFDAVEFDNVDGYANTSGFPLKGPDQLRYNVFLANGAHERGMSAVLKNDLDQIPQLLPYFDMELDEQCNVNQECDTLTPFVKGGKPVFDAEYTGERHGNFCPNDQALGINGVEFAMELDGSVFNPCPAPDAGAGTGAGAGTPGDPGSNTSGDPGSNTSAAPTPGDGGTAGPGSDSPGTGDTDPATTPDNPGVSDPGTDDPGTTDPATTDDGGSDSGDDGGVDGSGGDA